MPGRWNLRGWNRRDGLMLAIALVLIAFVGYLINANHEASMRQRQANDAQVQADTALLALVLGHFLREHQGTVGDLAAAPELTAYFENRAMGMSQEYGLRQSLLVIGERFDVLRQRRRLGDEPLLSSLRFLDRDGTVLVGPPLRPGRVVWQSGIHLDAGLSVLTLAAPVMFRGGVVGMVEASVGLPLLRGLLGSGSGDGHRSTMLADAADLRVLLADGPTDRLPQQALDPIRQGGGRALVAFDDDEHHHLVSAVPVEGAPLVVVSLRGTDRMLGSEPWHGLALMVLLSLLLLGGALALAVHMMRSRQLGARVAELEVRGEIESARNRENLGREISARKLAEEQRAQLGYAVEQAAESIIITDAKGVIEYVNPAFTTVTGWSRDEAVGRNPSMLKSGVHDRAFYVAMWGELLAGRPWSGRLTNRHRDGSLFHEDATISPVRDEHDRIVRFVAVKRDVTAVMRMEEQLHQAQKLESIGQLAAGIAHEINTPIQFIGDNLRFISGGIKELGRVVGAMRGLVEGGDREAARRTLEESDVAFLDGELPKALAQSLDGVDRVAEIVRSMKDFSHPGSQTPTPSDLNRAIESTVTVSRSEWKYIAGMELQLAPDLPLVPLLVGDFNQVMLNLIVNAAHAIAARGRTTLGRIAISTVREGDRVVVRVADDGCGIPESVKPRIFEPFFTTKPVGKGTGQGLAMARSVIIGKLHGTISFDSHEGVGTTFTISLAL